MPRSVFARAQWAVGCAALLAVGAMARYPGGTPLDPTSVNYSITHNFLSDLGMTVAWNGQSNRVGAMLFVSSLGILLIGLGGCLVGLVRLYSRSPESRRLARAAGAVGFLVCGAFAGVALTPENQVMTLHLGFTLFAFRVFPIVTLLLGLASMKSRVFPPRVTVAWAMLTLVLVAYVAVLGWGPTLATTEGLQIQVAAQKIVTVVALSVLVYLSAEADGVASVSKA